MNNITCNLMILSTNRNDFPANHILWSDIKINFMGASIISQWMMHIGNNAGWKINEPNMLQFRFRNIRKIYLFLSNYNRFSMYPWYPTDLFLNSCHMKVIQFMDKVTKYRSDMFYWHLQCKMKTLLPWDNSCKNEQTVIWCKV